MNKTNYFEQHTMKDLSFAHSEMLYNKGEPILKSAKLFFIGLHIHLILSILVIVILFIDQWGTLGTSFLGFYLFMIAVVVITGWVTVVMAFLANKNQKYDELKRAWKLLKLGSIPFYIVNFFYSFFVWFVLVAASRGIFIIFVPIPIILTCTFIFQSGCVSAFYINSLRYNIMMNTHASPYLHQNISSIHYLLQFIPVLDVISTFVILNQCKIYDRRN